MENFDKKCERIAAFITEKLKAQKDAIAAKERADLTAEVSRPKGELAEVKEEIADSMNICNNADLCGDECYDGSNKPHPPEPCCRSGCDRLGAIKNPMEWGYCVSAKDVQP